jgi:hypothetical protein
MRLSLILIALFFSTTVFSLPAIYTGVRASRMEVYAALELQRYLYQTTGSLLPVKHGTDVRSIEGFIIGTPVSNPAVVTVYNPSNKEGCGEEGYYLQRKNKALYIVGETAKGCLYGVYGLLEDYYQVGFYMGGDVIPAKTGFFLPDVKELKKPSVKIRGFLPWTNFPQSATVYSWNDWKFIIDQAAKMRMNFIHIHNYNGQEGHNEMFHNFTLNGITSRVWMPTAKTGHKWNCPGFDIKDYRFGAGDLFDDYDFGSDCALHNETLSNEMVFRKGVSLFKRVIAYAHSRGIKIGLGLDIDLIPPDYKTTADDPKVIEARMKQVVEDYADLDYLILFVSELINNSPEKLALWKRTFDGMYSYLKQHSKNTKVAVAGWGLSKEIAAALPADVIAAPISHYSDAFEDGSIYGNREYWGCPWMERDFSSSQYYYPYNMHLSNTIKAWKQRAPNMTGLYTLTWRLTDAIDPKLSFIAKAPWHHKNEFNSSYDVYYNYAVKHFGKDAAPLLTTIINENEPLSANDAECQPTGQFTGKPPEQNGYLLNMRQFGLKSKKETTLHIGSRYSTISKAAIEKRNDADSCIAWVEDSSYVHFANVSFTKEMDTLVYFTATANPFAHLEMRIDSLNGRLIAFTKVPETGGWHNWQPFTTAMQQVSGVHDVYIRFRGIGNSAAETEKAVKQLALIDSLLLYTTNKFHSQQIQHLRSRLEAAYQHTQLNLFFPSINKAEELPYVFEKWVHNFTSRVTDISSLGNVQSIQNRYIQERYVAKENELLKKAVVKFPTDIVAKGTETGAIISWNNNEPECKGYNLYTNGVKMMEQIPCETSTVEITGKGLLQFRLTAVNSSGIESELSAAATCYAGNADTIGPQIIMVSPPSSVKQGSYFSVKARLLDNRQYHLLKATLYYRIIGEKSWKSLLMQQKTKGIFTADLFCSKVNSLEYFIEATDGLNSSLFPVQKNRFLSFIIEPAVSDPNKSLLVIQKKEQKLYWPLRKLPATSYYVIYRSKNKISPPSAATLLTYLPPEAQFFEANGYDENGNPLKGTYYYLVSVLDIHGVEKARSGTIAVTY